MTKKDTKAKCPWCSGVVGEAYTDLEKRWLKITTREQGEIDKYKDKPLSIEAIKTLITLSMGYTIYEAGGHPWIKGGAFTCNSYIYALFSRGYIKMELQRFSDKKLGREWSITETGDNFIEGYMRKQDDEQQS